LNACLSKCFNSSLPRDKKSTEYEAVLLGDGRGKKVTKVDKRPSTTPFPRGVLRVLRAEGKNKRNSAGDQAFLLRRRMLTFRGIFVKKRTPTNSKG